MQNEAELHFFRKLLEQFHVNFRILGEHDGPIPELDLGLRRLFRILTRTIYWNFNGSVFFVNRKKSIRYGMNFSVTISFSNFRKTLMLPTS